MWVTGTAGVGKSTVCAALRSRGHLAIDADWEGYNRWVDRRSGEIVADPPYPVPAGWLDRYAWRIIRAKVEALVERAREETAFLCGYVENEEEVRDLFELVVCLVADAETIRDRLQTRATNAFGRHPEELAAALDLAERIEAMYRSRRATIIDARRPAEDVADAVLAAAARVADRSAPAR